MKNLGPLFGLASFRGTVTLTSSIPIRWDRCIVSRRRAGGGRSGATANRHTADRDIGHGVGGGELHRTDHGQHLIPVVCRPDSAGRSLGDRDDGSRIGIRHLRGSDHRHSLRQSFRVRRYCHVHRAEWQRPSGWDREYRAAARGTQPVESGSVIGGWLLSRVPWKSVLQPRFSACRSISKQHRVSLRYRRAMGRHFRFTEPGTVAMIRATGVRSARARMHILQRCSSERDWVLGADSGAIRRRVKRRDFRLYVLWRGGSISGNVRRRCGSGSSEL